MAANKSKEAVKDDYDKARFDLIPPQALRSVADAFTYGAKKYGDHNWESGIAWSRLYAAAERHLNSFWSGQGIDDESNLPHLAHAAANILMLLHEWFASEQYDDRTLGE